MTTTTTTPAIYNTLLEAWRNAYRRLDIIQDTEPQATEYLASLDYIVTTAYNQLAGAEKVLLELGLLEPEACRTTVARRVK